MQEIRLRSIILRYTTGSGVAVDKAEAFKCFKRAAEAVIADAQLYLGHCYANANGVAVDKDEAKIWVELSAQRR